ncbi:MAG: 7-cyano-7-deazaguanine synthase, partial [Actinobacteria bacterium]|nr:7-cyano-7-deazaguanine synthase [Actinomycetota bacterium]
YTDVTPDVDQVSPTYVPFRNGNLLSAAAAIALGVGASRIYYGAHSEDARNWAYPDCTPEFNGAMANAIYVGTYHKVRLITPLQNLNKRGVIDLAAHIDAPLELTWSCYQGGEIACGECPTCTGRIKAFMAEGFIDPVPYAIDIDWRNCVAW